MLRVLHKSYNKIIALIKSKSSYKFIIKDYIKLDDIDECRKVLNTKRFSTKLQPLELSTPLAKKIIVIAPHPDDDILGAGGTLLKAKDQGSEIHILYVTNGLENKSDKIKNETMTVCEQTGFKPYFLNFNPKDIDTNNKEMHDKILSIVSNVKPQVIFISFFLDNHYDHRMVNLLLYNSMINSQYNQKIEIWAYQIYSTILPNVVIDITEKVDEKRRLINIWKSVGKFNDLAHYILGINASNSIFLGKKKSYLYGETFFAIPIKEYFDLCSIYFFSNE